MFLPFFSPPPRCFCLPPVLRGCAVGAAVLEGGLGKMSAAKMKKACMRLGMWVGKKPTVARLRQLLQPVLTGVLEHSASAARSAAAPRCLG